MRALILGLTLVFVMAVAADLGGASLARAAPAGKSAVKRQRIRQLLKLTGAARMGRQILVQMVARMRGSLRKVPDAFWTAMIAKAKIKDLMREVVAVYDKHLTLRDINGLLAFYKSPLGRRFIKLQPLLMRDSMRVGATWGRQFTRELYVELDRKGLLGKHRLPKKK